jgi:hypothetical protein
LNTGTPRGGRIAPAFTYIYSSAAEISQNKRGPFQPTPSHLTPGVAKAVEVSLRRESLSWEQHERLEARELAKQNGNLDLDQRSGSKNRKFPGNAAGGGSTKDPKKQEIKKKASATPRPGRRG